MLFSAQKAEVNNFSVTGQSAFERSQVLPVEKAQRHKKERSEGKRNETDLKIISISFSQDSITGFTLLPETIKKNEQNI